MNNQFNNRSYNMNILQDISYVVTSIQVMLIFLRERICGNRTFWDGEGDWPWNPLGQLQVKELAPSTHVPPFWQGDDRHSSKSRSHFFPGPQNVRSLHTLSCSDRETTGTRPGHAHSWRCPPKWNILLQFRVQQSREIQLIVYTRYCNWFTFKVRQVVYTDLPSKPADR